MKNSSRQIECEIVVRHGLLYDVIDTNDEVVSGRDFPELLRSNGLQDWRFFETPALGIISPKTGRTLWIPRQAWFSPSFRHVVYPDLRPSFEEWKAGSYRRSLSIRQLHQALRSAEQAQAGKWHSCDCRHDDCPLGCGPAELTPESELEEVRDAAKFRGIPRREMAVASIR